MPLRFTKTDAAARVQSKADFKLHCCATGLHASETGSYGYLCSAHIFPRSTFPDLANCIENRLPIVFNLHCYPGRDCLDLMQINGRDTVRPVHSRLEWLRERCGRVGYWEQVKERIQLILSEHQSYDPRFNALVPELQLIIDSL